ncbi:DUF2937 family protein [Ferrimonas pelagia]|uniref:DUF2937 family protein n=1 Tax=Ferrimonas pelagia TaxID=1177826 RepID=A0ABP9F8D1_9GAMM
MLKEYARLALFVFSVLLGVQIPGFVDLYQQRLEAHTLEARLGLQGFQQTADQYFHGDLGELILHYKLNPDPVFRRDGDSIGALVARVDQLTLEQVAMDRGQLLAVWHLLVAADPALRQEAVSGYSYRVVLTPMAIGWGIGAALLLGLLLEGFGRACVWCWCRRRRSVGAFGG